MTNSLHKSRADHRALGSMSIRELLVELASPEDDRSKLADASDRAPRQSSRESRSGALGSYGVSWNESWLVRPLRS